MCREFREQIADPEFEGFCHCMLYYKSRKKGMIKMAELVLTEQNFEEEVLRAKKPVLVDFWATWCGPCRMLAPVIEEIANEYEGKVKVGKVNVDDERELALQFGVNSIPTVMVFQNGEIKATSVGYRPEGRNRAASEVLQKAPQAAACGALLSYWMWTWLLMWSMQ